MDIYIYSSHMGGFYVDYYDLPFDELYCEECGDSDMLIGKASTREEAKDLLMDYYCIDEEEVEEWAKDFFDAWFPANSL